MRLLYMTDIHSNFGAVYLLAKSEDYDLILLGGDLLYSTDLVLMWDLLSMLSALSDKEIIFVPGNWEPLEVLLWDEFGGAYNLHAKKRRIGDYIICGIGGVAPRQFFFPLEFDPEDFDYYSLKLEKDILGEQISIFSTHMIPYDNASLIRFIRKHKPNIALCGHIHEKKFLKRDASTIMANPGALYDDNYCLIDIEDKRVVFKNIGAVAGELHNAVNTILSGSELHSVDMDIIDSLYVLDKTYITGYWKLAQNINTGFLSLIEDYEKNDFYGFLLYKLAEINSEYLQEYFEKSDILLEIINSRSYINVRFAMRLLGLLKEYAVHPYCLEILTDKIGLAENLRDISLTLLELLKIPGIPANYEDALRDAFDRAYRFISNTTFLSDVFLFLANLALSDQKFIRIEEILDQISGAMERASLEMLGILLSGISRYASHDFLNDLAMGMKGFVISKLNEADTAEKQFFKRRIISLLSRNSIYDVSLNSIFGLE